MHRRGARLVLRGASLAPPGLLEATVLLDELTASELGPCRSSVKSDVLDPIPQRQLLHADSDWVEGPMSLLAPFEERAN